MSEADFANSLVAQLASFVAPYEISEKVNLLYALSIDERGNLQVALDDEGQAVRGRGTGFEQDILVFERVQSDYTSIVPRVIIEVKFQRMNTHSVLAYAEKARRIRTVYPYARYGLIIGDKSNIPPRVVRLGQGFDFILATSYPTPPAEIESLGTLLQQEIEASKSLASILPGQSKIKRLYRPLIVE